MSGAAVAGSGRARAGGGRGFARTSPLDPLSAGRGAGRGMAAEPRWGLRGNFKPVEVQKRPRRRALRRVPGKVNTGRAGTSPLGVRQLSFFSKPEKRRLVFLSAGLIVVFLVIGDFNAKWHSSVDFQFFLKGSQSDTSSQRGLGFSL